MSASNTGARHDPSASLGSAPPWEVLEDLHLHTNASDGVLTPTEMVEFVSGTSLHFFAITDHDTTSGLDEAEVASEKYSGITFIPGIELSSGVGNSDLHLVCHFVDRENRALQTELDALREDRESKAEEIVERLDKIGLPLDWDEVVANADGAIGRPHIARAMVARGYVETVSDAFSRYLTPGKPGYVSRRKLEGTLALELVHGAGGVATVAHPRTVSNIEEVLATLVPCGLAGIEVYAEKYGSDMIDRYSAYARHHGLVKSGGSDYHANGTVNEIVPGMNGPPPGTVRALYERAINMHGVDGVGYRLDESQF